MITAYFLCNDLAQEPAASSLALAAATGPGTGAVRDGGTLLLVGDTCPVAAAQLPAGIVTSKRLTLAAESDYFL